MIADRLKLRWGILFVALLCIKEVSSQQNSKLLPEFNAIRAGNRVIVGWTNKMYNVTQITIQQSKDSLFGYRTIFNVLDPKLEQNGYAIPNVMDTLLFYRLYILQEGGVFSFSKSQRAIRDTSNVAAETLFSDMLTTETDKRIKIAESAKPGYTPSANVNKDRDGYITVRLPNPSKPNVYKLRFFKENGPMVMELSNLKTGQFKIDKANFFHAGWFSFELYEGDTLIEKNLIYISKDF